MSINHIYALFALILILIGVALALVFIHRSESKARLEQLVVNQHGDLDVAAVAFWVGFLISAWVILYCTLKGGVPEGVAALYPVFVINIISPLLMKIQRDHNESKEK